MELIDHWLTVGITDQIIPKEKFPRRADAINLFVLISFLQLHAHSTIILMNTSEGTLMSIVAALVPESKSFEVRAARSQSYTLR